MRENFLLLIVFTLAVLGLLTSVHLLNIKYGKGSSFCDVSSTFSCTKVNHSSYGSVWGFPTAGIGIAGYLVIVLMCVALTNKRYLDEKIGVASERSVTAASLLGIVVVGAAIQVYYTLIEFFVLQAFCLYCLASQVIILAILGFAFWYYIEGL